MPTENNTETNENKKKKKSIWIIAVFLIPLMLLGAAYGYYYASHKADKTNGIPLSDIRKCTLKSFTANLSDEGSRRYVRTTITLEYTEKDLEKELNVKTHRMRDLILRVLRGKKVSDIDTPDKTMKLKNEILTVLNNELSRGNLTGLYFEELIIQ